MNFKDYVENIRFKIIQPEHSAFIEPQKPYDEQGYTGKFSLKDVPRHNVKDEITNTILPEGQAEMEKRLFGLCKIPRGSTFAIASIINRGISEMAETDAYVNIGTWFGFTFFAGMIDNPDKICIGVDNFSELNPSGNVKEAFNLLFARYKKSPKHNFFDRDYIDYFEKIHKEKIGFYLYDANHTYENQLKGLQIAEPFFSDNCIIMIDDTNGEEVYQSIIDFMALSKYKYEIILDKITALCGNPTFWNGIVILRKIG